MSNHLPPPDKYVKKSGFTLIELSIVLVIIGLIIGGILTGQDLINAASQRAQLAQIEKYNTAVHTFQNKYGYLPGDIPNPYASSFGFQSRGTAAGEGDGNGIIQSQNGQVCGTCQERGETSVFWVDLSTAGLIDGWFNTASPSTVTTLAPQYYFPPAKIGNGNYVYVYNNGYWGTGWVNDGMNYFGVSAVTSVDGGIVGDPPVSSLTMTVLQAYNIDKKIDDGFPQTGNVKALYINSALNTGGGVQWVAGGGLTDPLIPEYQADPATSQSCYDNSGSTSNPAHYETAQNANAQNCALTFRFQ